MGYDTDFEGEFILDKPLTKEQQKYLDMFSDTRRTKKNLEIIELYPDPVREAVNLPVGKEGGYCVIDVEIDDKCVKSYNESPEGQPGLWCNWIPNEEGTSIIWNNAEKFYNYVSWIKYIIDNFLKPWGLTLNGEVKWFGEKGIDDIGMIKIIDNVVHILDGELCFKERK